LVCPCNLLCCLECPYSVGGTGCENVDFEESIRTKTIV